MIKIKKILFLLLCISFTITLNSATEVYSAEPTVGAVNQSFGVTNATRLSVDIRVTNGEEGYHFYSLAPFFQNKNYGMYAGLQTNGNLGNGVDVGNIFVFSVWNATIAYPANGSTSTPFGGEGIGYSLRSSYDWTPGTTYRVSIERGSFDSTNNGYKWSANVQNLSTNTSFNLGEIVSPHSADTLSSGNVFHERYVGTTPVCNTESTNLEKAGAFFSNISANTSASFYGGTLPNNLFASAGCKQYIYSSSTSNTFTSVFGTKKPAEVMPNPEPENEPETETKPTPVSSPAVNTPATETPQINTDQNRKSEEEPIEEDPPADDIEVTPSESIAETKPLNDSTNTTGTEKNEMNVSKTTVIIAISIFAIGGILYSYIAYKNKVAAFFKNRSKRR